VFGAIFCRGIKHLLLKSPTQWTFSIFKLPICAELVPFAIRRQWEPIVILTTLKEDFISRIKLSVSESMKLKVLKNPQLIRIFSRDFTPNNYMSFAIMKRLLIKDGAFISLCV
jgi:hypothetical protein